MPVRITGAEVTKADGTAVAYIVAQTRGGGTAGRWDDARENIVQVTDPVTSFFHVRLLSQAGNLVPDELIEADTWEAAVAIGEAFLDKVERHAGLLAEFNAPLSDGLNA